MTINFTEPYSESNSVMLQIIDIDTETSACLSDVFITYEDCRRCHNKPNYNKCITFRPPYQGIGIFDWTYAMHVLRHYRNISFLKVTALHLWIIHFQLNPIMLQLLSEHHQPDIEGTIINGRLYESTVRKLSHHHHSAPFCTIIILHLGSCCTFKSTSLL